MIDKILQRLEFMGETCENALDKDSSLEERNRKWELVKAKYADLTTKKSK